MHQRLRLMVSLCRADNVTLDVTGVGSSHVSLTHCHPRDNWPAQDVALCLYYQMRDNTNSSRPVTSIPGLFLADSIEPSRMGIENICSFGLCIHWTSARHLKMLMADIASLPLGEEEENVSRSPKKLKSWLIGHLTLCCLWIPDNYWTQIRCHEDIVTSEETTVSQSPVTHHTWHSHVTVTMSGPGDNFIILLFIPLSNIRQDSKEQLKKNKKQSLF